MEQRELRALVVERYFLLCDNKGKVFELLNIILLRTFVGLVVAVPAYKESRQYHSLL